MWLAGVIAELFLKAFSPFAPTDPDEICTINYFNWPTYYVQYYTVNYSIGWTFPASSTQIFNLNFHLSLFKCTTSRMQYILYLCIRVNSSLRPYLNIKNIFY